LGNFTIEVTATKRVEWNQFFLNGGDRVLLDDIHLYGSVFLPHSGMVQIPFLRWLDEGALRCTGRTDVEMHVYNEIHTGTDAEWVEPMFNAMMWEALEEGQDLVGAEVGVDRGYNAEKILKHLPVEMLYLIDPYDENPDYQPGNPDLKVAKELAAKRLEPYSGSVVWVYEKSVDALARLSDLDFVYHDSDHRRANVERELPLGYAAVKSGGWWGGHDYKQTLEGECAVKSCVDEFVLDKGLKTLYYSNTLLNWWTRKQ
jgi:hypothetical protein